MIFKKVIEQLGGVCYEDLDKDTKILVAESVLSEKYLV